MLVWDYKRMVEDNSEERKAFFEDFSEKKKVQIPTSE